MNSSVEKERKTEREEEGVCNGQWLSALCCELVSRLGLHAKDIRTQWKTALIHGRPIEDLQYHRKFDQSSSREGEPVVQVQWKVWCGVLLSEMRMVCALFRTEVYREAGSCSQQLHLGAKSVKRRRSWVLYFCYWDVSQVTLFPPDNAMLYNSAES